MITLSSPPVLIAGGGIAGMATALELAHKGIASTVLEARGAVGTRENIFNVLPAGVDNLARLDPDGSLLATLTPVAGLDIDNPSRGVPHRQDFTTGALSPDPSRSRGDVKALDASLRKLDVGGADARAWGNVPIERLENAMRSLATSRFGDLVQFVPETKVVGARTEGDVVRVQVERQGGVRDSLEGAFLINATGRRMAGGELKDMGPATTWLGGRFAASEGEKLITRKRGFGGADGTQPSTTIALRGDDRTMVWAEVPAALVEPGASEQAQRAELAQRAAQVGVDGEMVDGARPAPVTMQLAASPRVVQGRLINVGDANRRPYFPTSSGALAAIVHDAPRAADAIERALTGERPVKNALDAYARSVRRANTAVMNASMSSVAADTRPLQTMKINDELTITELTPYVTDGSIEITTAQDGRGGVQHLSATPREIALGSASTSAEQAIAAAQAASSGADKPAVAVMPTLDGTFRAFEMATGPFVSGDASRGASIPWYSAKLPSAPLHVEESLPSNWGLFTSGGERYVLVDGERVLGNDATLTRPMDEWSRNKQAHILEYLDEQIAARRDEAAAPAG